MTLHDLDETLDHAAPSLPLPPAGGIRIRRRKHRRQMRRRRFLRTFGALLALALVVAGIVVMPKPQRKAPPKETAASVPAFANVPRVVVAHRGADGKALSVTVLSPSVRGDGGMIILMPPGTMAEVASLGLEPLGESLALGGPQRLVSTLENLLGVDLREAMVFDDAQLTAMLEPYGTLPIDIPARVEQVDPSGAVEVLYEPGVVEVQPTEVPRLLTAKGRGTAMTLLAQHDAFWRAFLERLRDIGTSRLASPLLQKSLGALSTGDVRVSVLPVQRTGTSDETSNDELYQLRTADLPAFLRAAFPEEARRIVARPRVQVLNGTGGVEVAPKVAEKLVPAGLQVTLTGNADRFDYEQTQIVFYDRTKQAMAERVRKALGRGRLVLSLNPLDVVDVTVIVGKDFTAK